MWNTADRNTGYGCNATRIYVAAVRYIWCLSVVVYHPPEWSITLRHAIGYEKQKSPQGSVLEYSIRWYSFMDIVCVKCRNRMDIFVVQ